MTDFNQIIDRKGTFCTQWDFTGDRFGKPDLLPFTISDTDFAVPDTVQQTLQQRLLHPSYGYTRWNHSYFKEAVAHWYRKQFALNINEDWLLYSPSVIYALSQLICLKSQAGQGIVVQTPAYDAFFKTIAANNRLLVENPLKLQNGHYHIDFDDLERQLASPNNTILLLCSPHNPTGRVWDNQELEQIVALCQKHDVFLISDEIHMDIRRTGTQHSPILKYQTDNVALLTSASKTFNFPGLIFSYLLIPDNKLREAFLKHLKNKDGLSSASILGMEATIAAYNTADNWLADLNVYLDNSIILTQNFLHKHLPQVKLIVPQATYLLWLDISQLGISMEQLQRVLIDIGKVAIMDGSIYGNSGKGFLRLNIGCSQAKLQDGLERLLTSVRYIIHN
jgi:cystathionine beta-lyase